MLRSEVEEHITEALGRYIRDPEVRARALMRMSVQGAVGRPGFYVVPADMLLSEAIMIAGGPAQDSNLDRIRIERGSVVLWEDEEAREALRQGLTLDQLNLQAGDQVVVPTARSGDWWRSITVVIGTLGTLSWLIYRFRFF